MDEFAEAVARAAGKDATPGNELEVRHPRDETKMPVVVDPITGEVHEHPGDLPTDRLAALVYNLRRAEAERRLWRDLLVDELRLRMRRDERTDARIGDYQITLKSADRRDWDADELEGVVNDLVATNVLDQREITELWRTKREVNGMEAKRLLDRLTGASHDLLSGCFKWIRRDPTVTIEHVPEQLPPGSETS
jgi:hypothetical protein